MIVEDFLGRTAKIIRDHETRLGRAAAGLVLDACLRGLLILADPSRRR